MYQYSKILDPEPDQNWAKTLDPDPNSMYLDPLNCSTVINNGASQ